MDGDSNVGIGGRWPGNRRGTGAIRCAGCFACRSEAALETGGATLASAHRTADQGAFREPHPEYGRRVRTISRCKGSDGRVRRLLASRAIPGGWPVAKVRMPASRTHICRPLAYGAVSRWRTPLRRGARLREAVPFRVAGGLREQGHHVICQVPLPGVPRGSGLVQPISAQQLVALGHSVIRWKRIACQSSSVTRMHARKAPSAVSCRCQILTM